MYRVFVLYYGLVLFVSAFFILFRKLAYCFSPSSTFLVTTHCLSMNRTFSSHNFNFASICFVFRFFLFIFSIKSAIQTNPKSICTLFKRL